MSYGSSARKYRYHYTVVKYRRRKKLKKTKGA
uniref:Uncharacterized protein n=1 Tax=Arundo donax TaxID=35708 RepID=A0A0A9H2L2_ARUDO